MIKKYNNLLLTIKIEENFYLNNDKYIHLFDEKELNKYFIDFDILKIEKERLKDLDIRKIIGYLL